MKNIILASTSPRRKELMDLMDYSYDIKKPVGEEIINIELGLPQAIEDLAYVKAKSILDSHEDSIVIGCDTVVVLEDKVLGKPKDNAEAKEMLEQLSGNTHQVITSVAILSKEESRIFSSIVEVKFYSLTDVEIDNYIVQEKPLDKAGAYGIQGKGSLFIESIQGDYYSVMGFPIAKVYQTLKEII